MILSERDGESVRFDRIERQIPSVWPVCDFCQGLKREKRLQPACLRDEGCHGRGWSHQQIDKGVFAVREIINEDHEWDQAQNTALEHFSLDREKR